MDRRIAMVGFVSAVVAASCSVAPPPGRAGSASPAADASPTAPQATPGPFGEWVPSAVVTLATPDPAALGDFFAQRLEADPARYVLLGQDSDNNSFLVEGSADATTWSRLDVTAFGGSIGDVAGGPLGLILTTHDTGTDRVHLWFSSDGRTWGRTVDLAGSETLAAEQLTAGPGGFAITGTVGPESDATTVGWTSTNGHDWISVRGLDSAALGRIEPLDGGFVAYGDGGGDEQVAVSLDGQSFSLDPGGSTSPLARGPVLVRPIGRRLLVVDRPPTGTEAWFGEVASDGRSLTWSQQPRTSFDGREVVAGTMAGSEAALLGYVDGSYGPVAWTSRNGSGLIPDEQGPGVLGGGVSALLASTGSSVATLGWELGDPGRVIRAIWRSADGADWGAVQTDLFGVLDQVPSPATCPSTPLAAQDLLRLTHDQFPQCYAGRTIEVTGFVTGCGGCGGVQPYAGIPSWLYDPVGFSAFWLVGQPGLTAGTDDPTLPVDIDPSHPVTVPRVGAHVRLTGHFDDPAASTCRAVPDPTSGAELPPAWIAIGICRDTFVATAITLVR